MFSRPKTSIRTFSRESYRCNLNPASRSNLSDLREVTTAIALTCYITKKVMSPEVPGLFILDAVFWRGPGRDRTTFRTDFPGSKMRIARWSPLLLAGFVIAALCRGQEAARPAPVHAGAPVPATMFRGSGSCSATACHGSIKRIEGPIPSVRRNEHTTWMSSDLHSRAYQVLFNERSKAIESRLAKPDGRPEKAHKDARCLVCHTTPRPAPELAATTWLNADGVGCETCHGASEKWLGPHTSETWQAMRPADRKDLGFRDTKSLTSRAAICVGCHVGEHSADGQTVRDVNHDLIAAGHPRLFFEFSAFLDNMPSHWEEKDENADAADPSRRAPDFAARAWAIGRLTTIKAALALLESRVTAIDRPPPALAGQDAATLKLTPRWPEFTEFGCFSCHHDLRDQKFRRDLRPGAARLGSFPWGTWVLPWTEDLVGELSNKDDCGDLLKALAGVTVAMQNITAHEKIAKAACAAAGPLEDCLAGVATKPLSTKMIEQLIHGLDSKEAEARITDWDAAAQRYLALVPLSQSWLALSQTPNPKLVDLRMRLEKLRDSLEFPPGYDSPRDFDPTAKPGQPKK
jgi:cytochrome c554/c'-like protein